MLPIGVTCQTAHAHNFFNGALSQVTCRGEEKPRRSAHAPATKRGVSNGDPRKHAANPRPHPSPGLEVRHSAARPWTVTPKGVLQPAACKASATREGSRASSWMRLPNQKSLVTSRSPVGDISVVTLIRTDTTLDHSQKAEKVCCQLV